MSSTPVKQTFGFPAKSRQLWLLLASLLSSISLLQAQNCNSLYLINSQDGSIYNISSLDGGKTFVRSVNGDDNLAVGPDPANPASIVFTHSNSAAGSTVFKSNTSIGTTLPAGVGGLTANPTLSVANTGFVYGVTTSRQLVRASPAPATVLGTITGDAIWTGGSISPDAFFDNTGRMYVVVGSGASRYIYRIDLTTLQATQVVQISGNFPSNFQGLAFYNNRIYAVEGYSTTILITSYFNAALYEINPNTGISTQIADIQLNTFLGPFSSTDALDLASCQLYTPTTAPTCNEIFGVNLTDQSVWRVDGLGTGTLSVVQVADGDQTNQGNLAYGPTPTNLNVNQFVTSPNNINGTIYTGTASTGFTTLLPTTSTIGSPIGLGTDPATGFVYGISGKVLTRWTGTGNGTTVGTITGDANWTAGQTLNDIAVDNGGNLYCIISNGASNVWLYRINPTTLVATPVVRVSGTYPTDLNTTNGNGLAYLGDFFYYSRNDGTSLTTIWRLDALTGQSALMGTVSRVFGDLASCAIVTRIPAGYSFNCGSSTGGIQGAQLIADGTTQTNVLRVPISNAINGQAKFTISGAGFTINPSPYTAFIRQGATFVDIPIIFDGSGPAGTRTITVTSSDGLGTGTCTINANVICSTVPPAVSATNTTICAGTGSSTLSAQCTTGTPAWYTDAALTQTLSSTTVSPAATTTYYATCIVGACKSASGAITITVNQCVAGTVDCAKTQLINAPVPGQPKQLVMQVTINVTVTGCFQPLSFSGSGLTLANPQQQLCATTLGLNTFYIPLNYNGSSLSSATFTLDNAGSCTLNLTAPPKKVIQEIWTLDCVPTQRPVLR